MRKRLPIIAIVGRANVGKSSLFNRLLNERRAIVADEPGTTRDSVTGRIEVMGKRAWLVDTAGLKTPEDELELSIQEQIAQATASADVIIMVAEAAVPPTLEDREVAKKALKSKKPVILAVNKLDQAKGGGIEEFMKLGIKQMVGISTIHLTGFDELVELVAEKLPEATEVESDKLKLAILGRPNVGKSTLFNALAGEAKAIVSDIAGTTRDINRVEIERNGTAFEIYDTAGIRHRSKSARGIEHFSSLRTLSAIIEADVCLLLIDSTEPATKLDKRIAGMVKESGRGLILALSKWDLLEADERTFDRYRSRISFEFQFVNWAPLVVVSATEKKNLKQLLEQAIEVEAASRTKLSTHELNDWLGRAVITHPPAGLKNTHPKLKYATQTDVKPPTIRLFGRSLKFLHWSYKRYLERQLREEFGIFGTPIRFVFSDSPRTKKAPSAIIKR